MFNHCLILVSRGLLFLMVTTAPALGVWAAPPPETFYVSPFGVDADLRPGSEVQPWRHIGYALGRVEVTSGDIIIVVDDGIEASDDYVENVTVSKSVKIHGADTNVYKPVVKTPLGDHSVFDVRASGVEIKGLCIYGAANYDAAIKLNGVSNCLIEENFCGMTSTHTNAYGILVVASGQNIIRDNWAAANTEAGICLWETSGNRIESNYLTNNANGILVVQSGSANLITNNVIRNNTGEGVGLGFGAATVQNVASGNVIEQNDIGVDLNGMAGGILTANTFRDNGIGLHVPAYAAPNAIFRNDFDNSVNIDSGASGYGIGSSMPLFYQYQSLYSKRFVGNFYADYTGSDANGDGIGDTFYGAPAYQDSQPLIDPVSSCRLYGWSLYHYNGIGRLVENSFTSAGDVVPLAPLANRVFSTTHFFTEKWIFSGGIACAETTWTGWLTFAVPPPAGQVVELTFGVSDVGGANFQALGPQASATGDGTSRILNFTADPNTFMLPAGKCLAVRLRNTGAANLEIMVGAAASMIFAPINSRPFIPLPPPLLLLLD